MTNKIAIRIKPLKKWADVANMTRHGLRKDPARHVDRTRTMLNEHWVMNEDISKLKRVSEGADLRKCFEHLGKAMGAKWRKSAAVGTEMIWIASPEFFNEAGPKGSKEQDSLAHEWAVACLKATVKKYPSMVAAARLDLDETTPHLSVFLLPMYEKPIRKARENSPELIAREFLNDPQNKDEAALLAAHQAVVDKADAKRAKRKPSRTVSHGTHFGNRQQLSDLQTWAFAAMQARGYDLERGTPKTTKGQDHTTPETGRIRIAAAEAEAQETLEAAQNELETLNEQVAQKKTTIETLETNNSSLRQRAETLRQKLETLSAA